jgi:protein-L-isoaspartate(D-aspartate) O-methyltransferase
LFHQLGFRKSKSVKLVAVLAIAALLSAETQPTESGWSGQNGMLHRIEQRAQQSNINQNRYWKVALIAIAGLDRRDFVPPEQKRHAYDDRPLPIGFDQTISDPFIVAYMTSLLKLSKSDTVLEIGTGSGYQAAILSTVASEVWTIEIIEPLAQRAAQTFENKGFQNIHVRFGDGYDGWPEAAPFDRIIVTAGAPFIPKHLLDQLKPGGRMIIPVGKGFWDEQLMLVTKDSRGRVNERPMGAVMFVDFSGKVRDMQR